MAEVVTSKILVALVLQTFPLCLSQSELLDEECLLQNHIRPSGNAYDVEKEFAIYLQVHGREYEAGTEEFKKRKELFTKRFHHVQAQNQRKNALWTAAVNSYTDRTEEELARLRGYRGYTKSAGHIARHPPSQLSFAQTSNVVIPEKQDWSNLKTVQAVMDQGSCGSCWAVAAAVTLQANAENTCHNRSFSAQEIVSCVQNPHHCGGSGGCEGATVELAFQYVLDYGLKTAEEVPYMGTDGSCNNGSILLGESGHRSIEHMNDVASEGLHLPRKSLNHLGKELGLSSWSKLPENQYRPLMLACLDGPVAVSVAASGWYSYNGGIFDGCDKDAEVDHAVTLIGFGKENNNKYWKIKNSWGSFWGEEGRIRLLRTDQDDTDQCGTDHKPEIGTACDGGPKEVRVCGMCGILYDSVVPHFEKAC